MSGRVVVVSGYFNPIHPGHVRIINKAKKYGKVYIALTTVKEIKKKKKIIPDLNYYQRKEMLMSLKNITCETRFNSSTNFFIFSSSSP